MKGVGLFLIILSCSFMGFAAGEALEKRLAALEQAEKMLQLLAGELRCSYIPFPQAFRQVAERLAPPWKDFLEGLSNRLEQMSGERLQRVWEDGVDGLPEGCGLRGEDRRELASLGKELGYLDLTMQLRTLEHFLERWNGRIQELRQELPAKRKIDRCLGISAGLLLALVLL